MKELPNHGISMDFGLNQPEKKYLQPDEQYFLLFSRPTFPVPYNFRGVWGSGPCEAEADQKVGIPCSRTLLAFATVAGTPSPRFTTSASISCSLCSPSGSSSFRLSLTVTSLERQPITFCTNLDGTIGTRPQDLSFRWERSGFEDLVIITRESGSDVDTTRRGAEYDRTSSSDYFQYSSRRSSSILTL